MKAATPLADVLEDDWDRQLFRGPNALAPQLGWTSYHTLRSKGSKAGYPDRTLVRERIVFAELKREKTKPTSDQIEWLDRLATAGGEVYLWRPSDLDEIALILSKRWRLLPSGGHRLGLPYMQHSYQECWTPLSLWVAGQGRSDSAQKAAA